ncbi:hypothetical protein D3C87_1890400 [compost metagenome]
MVWIGCVGKRLVATGEEIEVIYIVAMASYHRVVSFWNEHGFIVFHTDNLIQRTVFCINLLNCVTLRLVDFVKIDFFEIRFEQVAVSIYLALVVLMRRE